MAFLTEDSHFSPRTDLNFRHLSSCDTIGSSRLIHDFESDKQFPNLENVFSNFKIPVSREDYN